MPLRIGEIHDPRIAHLPQVGQAYGGLGRLPRLAQGRHQDADHDGDDPDDHQQFHQREASPARLECSRHVCLPWEWGLSRCSAALDFSLNPNAPDLKAYSSTGFSRKNLHTNNIPRGSAHWAEVDSGALTSS